MPPSRVNHRLQPEKLTFFEYTRECVFCVCSFESGPVRYIAFIFTSLINLGADGARSPLRRSSVHEAHHPRRTLAEGLWGELLHTAPTPLGTHSCPRASSYPNPCASWFPGDWYDAESTLRFPEAQVWGQVGEWCGPTQIPDHWPTPPPRPPPPPPPPHFDT